MVTWQLQEAKQRFSEVLRRATTEGPQIITRHGQEVAVILDIAQYRHLTEPERDFRQFLLSFPTLDDDTATVFDEVAAERARQLPRDVALDA